jgi:LytS/YehU family sensor histidine kinase
LENYLSLEHLRFEDKFKYELIVDPGIPVNQLNVSPGLVQPVVENAIWHGVRGLTKRKGFVSVSFNMEKGNLVCTVKDDGIGFKRSEELKSNNSQKNSKGIYLVTERLRIINSLEKKNYRIMISELYPDNTETGTLVIIDIPVKMT